MNDDSLQISIREVLHFLGWRGTPVDDQTLSSVKRLREEAMLGIQPRCITRRFHIEESGLLLGTLFAAQGNDVQALLTGCEEAVLMAVTLGAQSERMLLRKQAMSAVDAVLMDAVLSAMVESVCEREESRLREELKSNGLYLTSRFSPGYGDMPLAQSREICEILSTAKTIGLTVSASGIMIPRKSVTAIMGISSKPVTLRREGCEVCEARETCPMRRTEGGKKNT